MLDIIKELREFEVDIDIWDPQAYADEVKHEYGIDLVADPKKNNYDAVDERQLDFGLATIRIRG